MVEEELDESGPSMQKLDGKLRRVDSSFPMMDDPDGDLFAIMRPFLIEKREALD